MFPLDWSSYAFLIAFTQIPSIHIKVLFFSMKKDEFYLKIYYNKVTYKLKLAWLQRAEFIGYYCEKHTLPSTGTGTTFFLGVAIPDIYAFIIQTSTVFPLIRIRLGQRSGFYDRIGSPKHPAYCFQRYCLHSVVKHWFGS